MKSSAPDRCIARTIRSKTAIFTWVEASKGIRTIFATEHDQTVLEGVKALLALAADICLLGFGFHRENIDLLDLVGAAQGPGKRVFSSRYKISNAEWVRYTRPFANTSVSSLAAHQVEKCLEALRNMEMF